MSLNQQMGNNLDRMTIKSQRGQVVTSIGHRFYTIINHN